MTRDYADLQVLSQLAWFDEYFLADPDVSALIQKGEDFDRDDQLAVDRQTNRKFWRKSFRLMPTRPAVEPWSCRRLRITIRFCRWYAIRMPEESRRPACLFPRGDFAGPKMRRFRFAGPWSCMSRTSAFVLWDCGRRREASRKKCLALRSKQGIQWMATDEGVLGRSVGYNFTRDGHGRLHGDSAEMLYNIHRYEKGETRMNMVFRDHTLSDLIGFVYSGMPPQDAANHLLHNIREAAQPVLERGRDAVVPIILDGENAWEYYPQSGREFLRRFYDGLQRDSLIEPVTISEAIERHKESNFNRLDRLVPGSWINANFNVWIGAPEDNKAWDLLAEAREYYDRNADRVSETQRKLAWEELLIAEGSDWNWWYGPEHHSANDRDFDELYRKHLSNVYTALEGVPPEELTVPIASGYSRPSYQSADRVCSCPRGWHG